MRARRFLRQAVLLAAALALLRACAFDSTLREYLSAHFWLPFAKRGAHFERPGVRRISAPFAGMTAAQDGGPLARLRAAYQKIGAPNSQDFDDAELRQAVAAARADSSLSARDREEIALIDAKIDMRAGENGSSERLDAATKKLRSFLETARTPEFLSEARGWLAHVYYISGEQTAAGKMYLDELNNDGSNLSRETLLNSLRMTYGYDGGATLREHLAEYFDTPEHAAFAIQLTTNPHWPRDVEDKRFRPSHDADTYARIKNLLQEHKALLASSRGANALALLAMRTALRMGDPAEANRVAGTVPANAAIRREPDFNWMLGAARFLSHQYAEAEHPLLALFRSRAASPSQKAAAAYGLCGVYRELGNTGEQIRFALWLHASLPKDEGWGLPTDIADLSLYWAVSGWDLNMLLDQEASIADLRSFVKQNPNTADLRLVQYSLAVRLTREDRYRDAAEIYESIHAVRRAPRMRRLAELYDDANGSGLSAEAKLEAKYRLAEYIGEHPDGIYFNDALWHGLQRYALQGSSEYRVTRAERNRLVQGERELKDTQEERWRAYLILRDVVRDAPSAGLRRRAALLAARCLRAINTDRFGREDDIHKAEIQILRRAG